MTFREIIKESAPSFVGIAVAIAFFLVLPVILWIVGQWWIFWFPALGRCASC